MQLVMRAILELLRKFILSQFNEPKFRFRSLISASVGTMLNCQPRLHLSQSCFSSMSTTCDYTAAVDVCLKGSKDRCVHPSPSEESRTVTKYPEGKWAFKIRSGACSLVWLARGADYSHSQLCVGRSLRACFQGTGHPLDSEKRIWASL
ncbi:hypothetical protein RF11_10943 [Thelohanellus kitauei]|uniref:Uncharacterized protein n=1 Tax=Thelohanellus kitauei TaxID=669202 RepID=A0A0C2MIU7_THEKT|nr:hypothetical protein RF11_10943 [Thelohanellus kitauei]